MNPEIHQPQQPQERPPRPPSPYEQSLNVQRMIMGRLKDQDEQMDWIDKHAATFRKLFDQDRAFRASVDKEDIDDILNRIARDEGRLQ